MGSHIWARAAMATTAATLALCAALPASASVAYAYAQRGFNERIIGDYTASDAGANTQAQAGIGYAEMSGGVSGRNNGAYSGSHSRTDFTVEGLAANAPLTFTWLLEEFSNFTNIDASWGWTAGFGVSARFPFGGSYSLFGNQVTQGPYPPYSIGNPDSIVQCNGNTRGQSFCGQRRDTSSGLLLSVTGAASSDDRGYIEQTVHGDGWNVDFSVRARLVAVSVPSAIYLEGDSAQADVDGMLQSAFSGSVAAASASSGAYLRWQDGSTMQITVDTGQPVGVPAPAPLALLSLAFLVLAARQRRR